MSIQPYQFEPRRPPDQVATSQNSNSTPVNAGGSGGTPGGAPSDRRTLDTFWCRCGNCRIMPTVTECICCAEVPNIVAKNGGGDAGSIQCIVDHGHFAEVCLLPHVLGSVIDIQLYLSTILFCINLQLLQSLRLKFNLLLFARSVALTKLVRYSIKFKFWFKGKFSGCYWMVGATEDSTPCGFFLVAKAIVSHRCVAYAYYYDNYACNL